MLRDVMRARIPLIFQKYIYAGAAILGIVVYLVLKTLVGRSSITIGAGVATMLLLRLAAVAWGWHLPTLHLAG